MDPDAGQEGVVVRRDSGDSMVVLKRRRKMAEGLAISEDLRASADGRYVDSACQVDTGELLGCGLPSTLVAAAQHQEEACALADVKSDTRAGGYGSDASLNTTDGDRGNRLLVTDLQTELVGRAQRVYAMLGKKTREEYGVTPADMENFAKASREAEKKRKHHNTRSHKRESFGWLRSSIKEVEGKLGRSIGQFFSFSRWVLVFDVWRTLLWVGLVVVPQLKLGQSKNYGPMRLVDVLTGQGYFGRTFMFYEGYDQVVGPYPMATMYVTTIALMTIAGFAVILLSMLAKVREEPEGATEGGRKFYPVATRLLCTWDFGLSKQKSVALLQRHNSEALKEGLWNVLQPIRITSTRTYVVRAMINLFSVALLGGGSYAIYMLQLTAYEHSGDKLTAAWTALCVGSLNLVIPTVLWYLCAFEKYRHPESKIKLTTIRVFVIKAAYIGAVVLSVYLVNRHRCWQQVLGQEMYRLLLCDIGFTCAYSTYGLLLVRFVYRRVLHMKNTSIEFNLSNNVIDVCYNQALIWIGAVYAPVVPAIGFVGTLLIFQCKRWGYMKVGCSPGLVLSSWNSGYFCLLVYMASMFCVTLLTGFFITNLDTCGPHANYATMFQALELAWQPIRPAFIPTIFNYLANIGFLGPLAVFLLAALLYSSMMGGKLRRATRQLDSVLRMEYADKKYLLQAYRVKL
eukprot:comp22621_c0_seq1/m.34755 comp22621_c0_seq1/g.34755  ORF comp22621_c0_seq1/g.34755 comp22621_c0_seq1/m.34755 type:complete len:683 (-) comp22621_c0_seq1:317-2365(-)